MIARPSERRVALITGANRGLGLECAAQLARLHPRWTVLLTARCVSDAVDAATQLQSDTRYDYSNIHAYQLDVTADADIVAITDKFPIIDYLICNAGISVPIKGYDSAKRVLDVNVYGVINTIKACRAHLSPHSAIIVVGSEMGAWAQYKFDSELQAAFNDDTMSIELFYALCDDYLTFTKNDGQRTRYQWPAPNQTMFAYGVSKALIALYVRLFAYHHRAQHIVTVCPGWCQTRLTNNKGHRSASEGAQAILWPVHHRQRNGHVYQDGRELRWQYPKPAAYLRL